MEIIVMISILDVIQRIETIAPKLAAELAKMTPFSYGLYTLISEVFNAKKNDPEDILTKIQTDPQSEIKLKQIEAGHAEVMKNIESQDAANARQREIEMAKITHGRDYIMQAIGILIVIGFFLLCGLFIVSPTDMQNKMIIITPMITAFMIVVHYYF